MVTLTVCLWHANIGNQNKKSGTLISFLRSLVTLECWVFGEFIKLVAYISIRYRFFRSRNQFCSWSLFFLCLLCRTDLRLNQPRYATLPNIMKAKSKAIKKFTPEELNVDVKSDLEVVEVTEPPKRKAGIILSSVDELIDKLKNEAHVIWLFDLSH